MLKFQQNWTIFYKIKLFTENESTKKLCETIKYHNFLFWRKILFNKKLSDLVVTLAYFY